MTSLVYDYKSIAARMKGELAPRPSQLAYDRGFTRDFIIKTMHEQLPNRCLECGSCGVQQYCANARCPWQTY